MDEIEALPEFFRRDHPCKGLREGPLVEMQLREVFTLVGVFLEVDPALPGEMTVIVRLKKVTVGTEVHIVQEGLPDVIPPDACTLGWQESLALLAKLVEAESPDRSINRAQLASACAW